MDAPYMQPRGSSASGQKKLIVAGLAAAFFVAALVFQVVSSNKKTSTAAPVATPIKQPDNTYACGQIAFTQSERDLSTKPEGPYFTCLEEAAKTCKPTSALIQHTIEGEYGFVRTYTTILSLQKRANGCEMKLEQGPLYIQKTDGDQPKEAIEQMYAAKYEHRIGECLYATNDELVKTLQNWDQGALPQPESSADYGLATCDGEYFEKTNLTVDQTGTGAEVTPTTTQDK